MHRISHRRQAGVTLIEVLVGFVIFMTSLVAVLDYVGNQVQLERISESRYRAMQILGEQFRSLATDETGARVPLESGGIQVRPASIRIQERFDNRRSSRELRRIEFLIRDDRGERRWTVLDWR